jgi:hypothetical protein
MTPKVIRPTDGRTVTLYGVEFRYRVVATRPVGSSRSWR